MYNRYIPAPEEYAPMPEERAGLSDRLGKLPDLLGKLGGLRPDSGDLLLILIVLLLWHEEGDRDLLLALGAALLLGDQGV